MRNIYTRILTPHVINIYINSDVYDVLFVKVGRENLFLIYENVDLEKNK